MGRGGRGVRKQKVDKRIGENQGATAGRGGLFSPVAGAVFVLGGPVRGGRLFHTDA